MGSNTRLAIERLGVEVVGPASELDRRERGAADGASPPCLAEGDACPPGQVRVAGGAVRSQIAKGELAEGLVAVEGRRDPDPVLEQCERLAATVGRAHDERPRVRQVPDQVVAPLAIRRNAARPDSSEELVTGQNAPACEGIPNRLLGAPDVRVRDPERAATRRRAADLARSREREEPDDVLGSDEVEGSAQRPGADNLTRVERRVHGDLRAAIGAQSQRPLRARQLLRLDGQHPAHRVRGRRRTCGAKALRRQPQRSDPVTVHG